VSEKETKRTAKKGTWTSLINVSLVFIARQHTDARFWYSNFICPSVRLSVHPWRSGIACRWKGLNILSSLLHQTV